MHSSFIHFRLGDMRIRAIHLFPLEGRRRNRSPTKSQNIPAVTSGRAALRLLATHSLVRPPKGGEGVVSENGK